MAGTSSWRSRAFVVALFVLFGALLVPVATASVETFHRFEIDAIANYTITQTCADGSAVTPRLQVIAGHEDEAESGVTTLDHDFLTVRIFGFDCAGFVNDFGTGDAEFTFSPSLQTAAVTGTVTTRDGRSVVVDMAWEGTGPIEVTDNVTNFQGFTGHFHGQVRDVLATGTVLVNGATLVDGSTTNARLETLEDTNISH
jgi:hypothetical protein